MEETITDLILDTEESNRDTIEIQNKAIITMP